MARCAKTFGSGQISSANPQKRCLDTGCGGVKLSILKGLSTAPVKRSNLVLARCQCEGHGDMSDVGAGFRAFHLVAVRRGVSFKLQF